MLLHNLFRRRWKSILVNLTWYNQFWTIEILLVFFIFWFLKNISSTSLNDKKYFRILIDMIAYVILLTGRSV